MSEVTNPFDPSKDYMKELTSNEKWEEGQKEYPYLRGLKRLAHIHRGGLLSIESKVVKVPNIGTSGAKGETPDCIAAVTVGLRFRDGTHFEASADASYKAHKAPFNKHLVATAESKAQARAIRQALNISQVAKEEMGSEEDATNNGPITDVQIEGIKKIAKRNKLSQGDVLKLIKREDLNGDISQLTHAEGIAALKKVNSYRPKKGK